MLLVFPNIFSAAFDCKSEIYSAVPELSKAAPKSARNKMSIAETM